LYARKLRNAAYTDTAMRARVARTAPAVMNTSERVANASSARAAGQPPTASAIAPVRTSQFREQLAAVLGLHGAPTR
jgi:hypothetical protein